MSYHGAQASMLHSDESMRVTDHTAESASTGFGGVGAGCGGTAISMSEGGALAAAEKERVRFTHELDRLREVLQVPPSPPNTFSHAARSALLALANIDPL